MAAERLALPFEGPWAEFYQQFSNTAERHGTESGRQRWLTGEVHRLPHEISSRLPTTQPVVVATRVLFDGAQFLQPDGRPRVSGGLAEWSINRLHVQLDRSVGEVALLRFGRLDYILNAVGSKAQVSCRRTTGSKLYDDAILPSLGSKLDRRDPFLRVLRDRDALRAFWQQSEDLTNGNVNSIALNAKDPRILTALLRKQIDYKR